MATLNEKLADHAVSHAIDTQHYSNDVVRRIIALLNRTDSDLFAQLTDALEQMPPGSFTVERLEQLLYSVRALNVQAYRAVDLELTAELQKFVSYESGYQYQLFTSVIPPQIIAQVTVARVNIEQVYAAAMARPFSISKDGAVPMKEYLAGLSEARAKAIRDAVRLGYIENEPIAKIVQRIRGTRANKYADGLMEAPRQHIEGMVRTAISHTAAFTRNRFYEANNDLLKGWQFLATLDSRTTITCASLSGKIFPIGKGPMPPRHINCRSTSVPITKSWKELGGADIESFSPTTRASVDGQVAADITFTDWLRKKPAGFQDEVLGATRGKLFRANEIEVDRFTNNKGIVYSLDELRKRDAELFEKAGL